MTDQIILRSEPINIIQGDDAVFDVFLYDKDGRPFDLTNFDEFKWCAKNSDNTIVEVTEVADNGSLVVKNSPDELGHLTVTVKADKTASLKSSERLQDFDMKLNNSGTPNPKTVPFANQLLVSQALCT